MAVCIAAVLAGCAPDREIGKVQPTPEPTAQQPAETQKPALPTARSRDAQLYTAEENGRLRVVNAYGLDAEGYRVDGDGNICSPEGQVLVAAENTERYRYLSQLGFASQRVEAPLAPEGAAPAETGQREPTPRAVVTLLLSGSPAGTDRIVLLESSEPGVAEIRANENAESLASGSFPLKEGQTAFRLSENGSVRVRLSAWKEGETVVTAKGLGGTAVANCVVTVKTPYEDTPAAPQSAAASGITDTAAHVHRYTETVAAPTASEYGYTLHVCACGYSYRDRFTEPLGEEDGTHVHRYCSIIVAPTSTERGYTLHRCECGDSYRDCYVSPAG